MTNWEIAQVFEEIADLLEIMGENPYKVRAYRKAARVLENLYLDVQDLIEENRLEEIPGIGEALAAKIEELVKSGRLRYHEELKKKVPPGLREMLQIPGVGAKTVQIIYKHLNISSIDELEEAARKRQLQELPGIGKKTEEAILHGISSLRQSAKRWNLNFANAIAKEIVSYMNDGEKVNKIEIAGSYRRGKETVGDLDIVVSSSDPSAVVEKFVAAPWVKEVVAKGETKATVITRWEIRVDLLVAESQSFPSALLHFTGSAAHNIHLRRLARERGWKISEHGILQGESAFYPASEEEFYQALGMSYIPPELREDWGEIEAAQIGKIPELVKDEDLRGDLHVHTTWSDGANTLEEVVEAARARGYQYLAITDHSKSLGVSNGLTEERLLQQKEEIERLNTQIEDFTLLAGTEVDILTNKELDFDDRILAELDLVIASIHSGFKQDRDTLTERIIAAIDNEHVDIIGHPTGRLLGRREPYPLDVSRVLEAAAQTKTALEINASPDRLDLKDVYIREGKELGVIFAINTDAHNVHALDDIHYGVKMARRGWLEKKDVLNALSLEELKKWLKKRS
ncbi:MAG: DNA polymerase/3'-5' exonuclease PolX [Thermoanaerobacterales bacterium 50_218]|nr:MAG: DNA polymerase/3'-5' exonuclease PolX [Thermoanaerobacterales bacterium 50_218]HAA89011.1 DNA polymerase/3'-5' exonuclease PolX [Peptococcaceae bacterium]